MPAANAPRSLFDAVVARGRVIRQVDLACIVLDGGGACVVPMQDLVQAQKWAQSRAASGNLLTDRGRFLDQFNVLVSRPGSQQATRGNEKQLEKLARAMKQAGYDLGEWTLPPAFKDPEYWRRQTEAPARRPDANPA